MGSCSSSKKPNEKPSNLTVTQKQQPETIAQKSPETNKQPINGGHFCDNNNPNVSNGKLVKPGEIGFNGDVEDGQDHTVAFRKKCTKKGGNLD